MVYKVLSATAKGIHGQKVIVESSISNALPSIKIVGLPDKAVEDAKERVLPAIKHSGFNLIPKKITINLAPSYIRKKGASLDLPIAISILGAYGSLKDIDVSQILFIGELALNGRIRYTNGILQALDVMENSGLDKVIIPKSNRSDIPNIKKFNGEILLAQNLKEVIDYLYEAKTLQEGRPVKKNDFKLNNLFSSIKGNPSAKRIISLTAAGRHHTLMIGSPGSGKTLAAKATRELMPRLSDEETYETSLIYSLANKKLPSSLLQKYPPFRNPHHTASYASIIGGGTYPQPGEISLANNGILFLDEFAEFEKRTLNALREPLEEGNVIVTRTKYRIDFPTKFTLIAATNPCPCGYHNDPDRNCSCTEYEIHRYQKKVSKVLLDRIDISTYIRKPPIRELKDRTPNKKNVKNLKEKIETAVNIQLERYKETNMRFNSELTLKEIDKFCTITREAQSLLDKAYKKIPLSPRGYIKTIRVAQTISDLETRDNITKDAIAESLSYRNNF
jgi:magnesium chelatase family protein